MDDPAKSLKYLKDVEEQAESILIDKQEIIDLDKRRQLDREGLRSLKNTDQDKTWLAIGPMLVKMPTVKAQKLVQKDYEQVDQEINKIRTNLKVKVNSLRDMEYQSPVPGLMLKSLDRNEMSAINQVLGRESN